MKSQVAVMMWNFIGSERKMGERTQRKFLGQREMAKERRAIEKRGKNAK